MRGPGRCRIITAFLLACVVSNCGHRPPPIPSDADLYSRAVNLFRSEHYREASADVDRGLAIAPDGSLSAWRFRLLRAEILLSMRETQAAAAALKTAPPAAAAFVPQMARYRLCQAHLAQLSHDLGTARTRIKQARLLAQSLPDQRLNAEIELRSALLDVANHDPAAGKSHILHVIAYAESKRDDSLRMNATGSMGYLLMHSGHSDEAVQWLKEAVKEARLVGARTSEARALGNLGYSFFDLGDLDKALSNFRLAEEQFTSIGNRFETQIWLGNTGNVEEMNRNFEVAATYYAKALTISRQIKDDYWTALWLNDLAVVSTELERWDDAERYNNEAVNLQAKAGDEAAGEYSLLNAGAIALGRGQADRAEKDFHAVLKHGPQEVRQTLSAHDGLAQAYAAQHRDALAEREFQTALHTVGRQQSELLDEKDKLTWFASVIRNLPGLRRVPDGSETTRGGIGGGALQPRPTADGALWRGGTGKKAQLARSAASCR